MGKHGYRVRSKTLLRRGSKALSTPPQGGEKVYMAGFRQSCCPDECTYRVHWWTFFCFSATALCEPYSSTLWRSTLVLKHIVRRKRVVVREPLCEAPVQQYFRLLFRFSDWKESLQRYSKRGLSNGADRVSKLDTCA